MSSFAYGLMTAKRAAADRGTSQTTGSPGISTYVDALSALVPAEALALYSGVIVPNVTGKTAGGGTVITDGTLMGASVSGLFLFSAVLYLAGRCKAAKVSSSDALRVLVPPAALGAWMLIQTPSIFTVWWSGSSTGARVVIAAFAAIGLGILAKGLGYQVDAASPSPRS